jgi:DNA helicase II / ATP-dependent DNA helicase PcrA
VDKRIVFAVAGSGKTTQLVSELNLQKRVLLITYTENNCAEIRRRVLAKFGYLPENITVNTYFTFLNSFCYRPLLLDEMRTKGICFERPADHTTRMKLTNPDRYVTSGKRVYHARMAKLLQVKGCIAELQRRVARYYDKVFVDEVQDFGGHDFNLLKQIVASEVEILLVGDFFQHTYSTSVDGPVNKGLHDSFERFKSGLRDAGLVVDTTSLLKSHRCSSTVCEFIREHIGVDIHPAADRATTVSIVRDADTAAQIYARSHIVKLFFKEQENYSCHAQTWGASKGQDHHQDVCVVMTDVAWKKYEQGAIAGLAALSRNKLYVACSRARGDLYLMPEHLLKKFKVVKEARHSEIP